MAGFTSVLPSRRAGHLRQAVVLVFVLTVLGVINISAFGWNLSLQWLPLVAVALWPRGAYPIYSIIALLILGVFQDWVSFGVPGQWALIYLLTYAFIRPFERIKTLNFGGGLVVWCIAMTVALVTIAFTGRVIYSDWPNWVVLFRMAGIASLFFPLIWYIRRGIQIFIHNREMNA